MSRIGKKIINIPEKVDIEISTDLIKVKGPKGNLNVAINPQMKVVKKENTLTIEQGKRLQLQLGFSHDIIFELPENIEIKANKTEIVVLGINKQLVGEVSAKIRSFRKPEPYKGKGIRYKDEYVRSKQGKTVGGATAA